MLDSAIDSIVGSIRGVYGIHVTDYDEHFVLQNKSDGKVSAAELEEIIGLLSEKFPNDKFIEAAIGEIKNFTDKVNIRDGLKEEEVDCLSPELLIDTSINEICSMISSNKEYYFKTIEEQFHNATHIS